MLELFFSFNFVLLPLLAYIGHKKEERRRGRSSSLRQFSTPHKEGYADAQPQPSAREMLQQLMDTLAENPGLLDKPGVDDTFSTTLRAAERELKELRNGISHAVNPSRASFLHMRRWKRRVELRALVRSRRRQVQMDAFKQRR
jgi:hypothetical protein